MENAPETSTERTGRAIEGIGVPLISNGPIDVPGIGMLLIMEGITKYTKVVRTGPSHFPLIG